MKYIFYSLLIINSIACSEEREDFNLVEEEIALTEVVDTVDLTVYQVTWDDILNEKLEIHKTIVVEGFLADPGPHVNQSNGFMSLHVYPRRNQAAGEAIYFSIPVGTLKNNVSELPEKFVEEDVKIVTNNEEVISIGAKVSVKFIVKEGYGDELYYYDFKSIEKASGSDVVVASQFDQAVELTDKLISDTLLKEVYGWSEGFFELPMMIFSNNGKMRIDFKTKTNTKIKSVALKVGEGPNAMNDLPEDFTERDFVLRDFKGNLITSKKVKVYGTWSRTEFSNSGIFYLEDIAVL